MVNLHEIIDVHRIEFRISSMSVDLQVDRSNFYPWRVRQRNEAVAELASSNRSKRRSNCDLPIEAVMVIDG